MKTLNKLYSIAKEFVKEYESNIKEIEVNEPNELLVWDKVLKDIELAKIENEKSFYPLEAMEKDYGYEIVNCYTFCLTFFPKHLHPKSKKTWLSVIEKLHRIDKVPYQEIVRLTELARKDSFWSNNFLSLTKLRMKDKQKVMYIVVFSEKFKAKQKTINRQTQEVIEKNSNGW
jgi:hypothetical protein